MMVKKDGTDSIREQFYEIPMTIAIMIIMLALSFIYGGWNLFYLLLIIFSIVSVYAIVSRIRSQNPKS
jgi:phage-related holin